ncbi:uncharacterized protein LOC100900397 [Galendromus occidentalis]|uniref:Uncharacterized protein LOC100900397 n=1 Tax=Galendromus occidentalis TaxID=34638 RepID=A0AAJ6QSH5_9ACAR|nr:uncharacterized protein LOC100900397 [Galendromus occidentalis]
MDFVCFLLALAVHSMSWRTSSASPLRDRAAVTFRITDLTKSCSNENWIRKLNVHSVCENCMINVTVQRCDFPETSVSRISEYGILCDLIPNSSDLTDFVLDCGTKLSETCEASCLLSYRQRIPASSGSTFETVSRIAVGVTGIMVCLFILYILNRIRQKLRSPQGRQPLSQDDV